MATSKESAFIQAVTIAQGVWQTAYASAFATYAPNGFGVFANLPTYLAALVTADGVFFSSVVSAANTNGVSAAVVGTLWPA
jgi:hypothetical protein